MGPDDQAADRRRRRPEPVGQRGKAKETHPRHALVALILSLALASPVWAKAPVDPKNPPPDPTGAGTLEHERPGQLPAPASLPRLPGYGPFQRLPATEESPWVVLAVRKKPYWQAGTRDPMLSNACALGEFVTAPMNRMIIRFTAPEGQAALLVVLPTHRHLLSDRRNLAKPNETYLFRNNNEPTCEVWINGKATPRQLNPLNGSSIGKTDPNALKKKLKAMDSWPD